jgi:carboxypeptidase D
LPDVPFDIGEMYSGLIPIDEEDPSRALFFVFQPTVGKPTDEIVIWLNGGPGGFKVINQASLLAKRWCRV